MKNKAVTSQRLNKITSRQLYHTDPVPTTQTDNKNTLMQNDCNFLHSQILDIVENELPSKTREEEDSHNSIMRVL